MYDSNNMGTVYIAVVVVHCTEYYQPTTLLHGEDAATNMGFPATLVGGGSECDL